MKIDIAGYFTKKVIIVLSAVATVFTIVAGIWGFEAHYASNKRVDKVEIVHANDIKGMEVQLAGALENTQHKMNAKHFQFMYDTLTNSMFELKRQMRRYPEDEILKEDYEELVDRRKEIKKKLNEALEKIKVN